MSDRIVISGLIVHAVIGVHAFEQSITQPLSLDVSFSVDINRAAKHDLLSDTHDYAAICSGIISFVEKTPCRLLETFAKNVADYLVRQFHLKELELSVTKKPKDMANVGGVSVSYTFSA